MAYGAVCPHSSQTTSSPPKTGEKQPLARQGTDSSLARFTWKDSWHEATKCPYIETYPQGWMFAIKAICKLVRDAQDGVIGVWPYNVLVDSVWGVFSFDNDEWPDSNLGMWRCVTLNVAVYIVLLLLLVVLAKMFPHIMNFYYAHFAILESARQLSKRQVVIQRDSVPLRRLGGSGKRKHSKFDVTR